jgi:hypothetical protein
MERISPQRLLTGELHVFSRGSTRLSDELTDNASYDSSYGGWTPARIQIDQAATIRG